MREREEIDFVVYQVYFARAPSLNCGLIFMPLRLELELGAYKRTEDVSMLLLRSRTEQTCT